MKINKHILIQLICAQQVMTLFIQMLPAGVPSVAPKLLSFKKSSICDLAYHFSSHGFGFTDG